MLLACPVVACQRAQLHQLAGRTSFCKTSSKQWAFCRTRPMFPRKYPSWWWRGIWVRRWHAGVGPRLGLVRPETYKELASWHLAQDVCKPLLATVTSSLSCWDIHRWNIQPCSQLVPSTALRISLKENQVTMNSSSNGSQAMLEKII